MFLVWFGCLLVLHRLFISVCLPKMARAWNYCSYAQRAMTFFFQEPLPLSAYVRTIFRHYKWLFVKIIDIAFIGKWACTIFPNVMSCYCNCFNIFNHHYFIGYAICYLVVFYFKMFDKFFIVDFYFDVIISRMWLYNMYIIIMNFLWFLYFSSFQWDFKMVREEMVSVSDIVMELRKLVDL